MIGATINSQTCRTALPPTKNTGSVPLAELSDHLFDELVGQRLGQCHDRELFSSLKSDRTRDDARAGVFIERFYNPQRRHSTLGYISPVNFEEKAMLA